MMVTIGSRISDFFVFTDRYQKEETESFYVVKQKDFLPNQKSDRIDQKTKYTYNEIEITKEHYDKAWKILKYDWVLKAHAKSTYSTSEKVNPPWTHIETNTWRENHLAINHKKSILWLTALSVVAWYKPLISLIAFGILTYHNLNKI